MAGVSVGRGDLFRSRLGVATMTPYRERREEGFYHPENEKPASTHAHHLAGLLTAVPKPKPEEEKKS